MMGAAMLKHHRFVQSLWALYRLVVSSITFVRHLYVGESGAALVYNAKISSIQIVLSLEKLIISLTVKLKLVLSEPRGYVHTGPKDSHVYS